ncbi:hypothetical protein Fmac_007369 [Flemingia macrophylla]|uniref:Uncharacterized protein n=1 Tax=Flemingia macrophylla TaxID=520843 RepID=A0ABD1MUF7_9FABA
MRVSFSDDLIAHIPEIKPSFTTFVASSIPRSPPSYTPSPSLEHLLFDVVMLFLTRHVILMILEFNAVQFILSTSTVEDLLRATGKVQRGGGVILGGVQRNMVWDPWQKGVGGGKDEWKRRKMESESKL